MGRLLLEDVQHVHHSCEADGIDRPVRIPREIGHQFQNTRASKSLQRLGTGGLASELHVQESTPNQVLNFAGKGLEILAAGADEDERFRLPCRVQYPLYRITSQVALPSCRSVWMSKENRRLHSGAGD